MGKPPNLDTPAADHSQAFEELVAALALGSIDPAETVDVRAHLAACAHCRSLLYEYSAVVDELAYNASERAGSSGLKIRLLAEAARDLGGGHVAEEPVPTRSAQAPESVPLWGRVRLAYALPMAALLLLGLGLGWWSLALQQQLSSLQAEARLQQNRMEMQASFITAVAGGGQLVRLEGTPQAPGSMGEVVQPVGGSPPMLAVHGLPELPPGQVYQVWLIAGGQPVHSGFVSPSGPNMPIVYLERPLGGAATVALTMEPAGGSPGPTGPIFLAGSV